MRISHAVVAALILGLAPGARGAEVMAPSSVPISQAIVALGAGSDAVLGAGANRRYLCLMNIGTDLVTLGFDKPAVAGSGWALEPAAASGHQGGSMCWEGATVAGSVVHAISTAGSTMVVLEAR